jgi:predicted site-specific integrase-resolvase
MERYNRLSLRSLLTQVVVLQNQTINMLAESQLKNNDLLEKLLTIISIESGDITTKSENNPQQEQGSEPSNTEHESTQEQTIRKQTKGDKPEV